MPALRNTVRSGIVGLMDAYLEVFDISEDFLGLVMNAMLVLKVDMGKYCKRLEQCSLQLAQDIVEAIREQSGSK